MSNEIAYAPDPRSSPLVLNQSGGNSTRFTTRTVVVSGVAQKVVSRDGSRISCAVSNTSGTLSIWLGDSPSVSVGSRIELGLGCTLQGDPDELWAVTAGTSITLVILEFFK